jgi:hypothetical protein
VLVAAGVAPLRAQDTTVVSPAVTVVRPQAPRADGATYPKPPVSPMGAFLRSLVVPGWSQSILDRRLTAGLFLGFEGLALGMLAKTTIELNYVTGRDSVMTENKKTQQQDWITLLAFNHLFAGLEAYVAAHLWDFPADVKLRAVPVRGGVGATVTVPFRLR